MGRAVRSASNRTGITIRTRTAKSIFAEESPQNSVPFGASSVAAGGGANLLATPAAGKTWVVTSLFVSCDAINGAGCNVAFTGGLAVLFQSFGAGPVEPKQLLNAPFAVGASLAFAYTSTGAACKFSIAGAAYQATIPAGVASGSQAQLIAATQDGNPSADLG